MVPGVCGLVGSFSGVFDLWKGNVRCGTLASASFITTTNCAVAVNDRLSRYTGLWAHWHQFFAGEDPHLRAAHSVLCPLAGCQASGACALFRWWPCGHRMPGRVSGPGQSACAFFLRQRTTQPRCLNCIRSRGHVGSAFAFLRQRLAVRSNCGLMLKLRLTTTESWSDHKCKQMADKATCTHCGRNRRGAYECEIFYAMNVAFLSEYGGRAGKCRHS